ncbi:hypothetical protein [Cupriavidus sp. CP313]
MASRSARMSQGVCVSFAQSANDGVVFELEHVQAGSVACQMTPLVRIPASGSEMT